MPTVSVCPSCGSDRVSTFYRVAKVPAHSVLLLETREEAINYPNGQIELGLCADCGFIYNTVFDQALNDYAERYEATQSFSPTFSAFARGQALDLIDRLDLRGKRVLEIGCGQGEFILQLCELGDNQGLGYDPAYRGDEASQSDRVQFFADFYTEKSGAFDGAFICCKMTLEHIPDPYEFVSLVRRCIAPTADPVVYFQIPNANYVLQTEAFWDVYYEHCSYFTPETLQFIFERAGFAVQRVYTDYDDQYLMIEAKVAAPGSSPGVPPAALARIQQDVERFSADVPARIAEWRASIQALHAAGQRIVLWGGGSKGVAFLTSLGITDEIRYVVDVNPRKNGMFMAGTGQEIVLPEFLKEYRPDTAIVMNPIYIPEIQAKLDELGVPTQLLSIESVLDG